MSGRPGRPDDELVLKMLSARSRGMSSYKVADRLGMTSTAVRTITNRVRDADAAESGEDTTGFYW